VLIYQGVESAWMDGGAASDPDLPIVEGRDLVLRGFVTPHQGFQPRELVMVAYLLDDTRFLGGFEASLSVAGPSVDTDLNTTFNLTVPGYAIQEGARIQVKVLEKSGLGGGEEQGRVEFPAAGGEEPLTIVPGPHLLRVHLIPVQYDADGSGRLPDISDAQVQLYQDIMWSVYPSSAVEVVVGEPFPWSSTVSASGSGWDQLLNAIGGLRDARGVDVDEYLYGVFNATDDFGSFCGGGCVLGLSNLAMAPGDSYSRASIGIGYTGADAAWTMVHEVGHAHGLSHAPCGGAAGPDPNFPYSDGGVGARGLDMLEMKLKESGEYKDFMGYCSPNWVSDYNFGLLHDRVVGVNALASPAGPSDGALERGRPWASLWVHSDGTAEWTGDVWPSGTPGGFVRRVALLDGDGAVIDVVDGFFSPFDHLPGGRLVVPTDLEFVSVELEGRRSPPRAR
jgi:hypothetical protein